MLYFKSFNFLKLFFNYLKLFKSVIITSTQKKKMNKHNRTDVANTSQANSKTNNKLIMGLVTSLV